MYRQKLKQLILCHLVNLIIQVKSPIKLVDNMENIFFLTFFKNAIKLVSGAEFELLMLQNEKPINLWILEEASTAV